MPSKTRKRQRVKVPFNFFRLPGELRNLVYVEYFSNTRLTHGRLCVGMRRGKRQYAAVAPSPNSIALLRTCRRITAEIGDGWIGLVLFNFEDIVSMLDKLTAIPQSLLSKIRHVRVRGEILDLCFPLDADRVSFSLVQVLDLLPGLRLDTLTVLQMWDSRITYWMLEWFLMEGQGWAELRIISRTSRLLGYNERHWRKPQPADWIGRMEQRDGAQSHPCVTVYRSTMDRVACSVLDEVSRTQCIQTPPPGYDKEVRTHTNVLYELLENEAMMHSAREIMVVAKRGSGVDYELGANPDCAIRQELIDPDMGWPDIKRSHVDTPEPNAKGPRELFQYDEYDRVDEYQWTLFNVHPSYPPIESIIGHPDPEREAFSDYWRRREHQIRNREFRGVSLHDILMQGIPFP